ncbi:MAG: hypothetical protein QOC89_2220 [Paraburkholderia sp.]|jgi:hypothetical protein|uniref:DUF4148 domain-containing protein n=1 Tax=Paraburkholderia sp. TaxID=1926495 RepID=UPI002AFE09DF|nr:DUF4148 domain-containing protein [Paraburkholderia sp.]MEA3084523.1 hypothetical protein [Paraburkholderia sp.]MEA3131774.1 hypothetical protein [Paraburkholderia sp.]
MKLATRSLVATLLLIGSASAMAAPGLTPQQCNSYPFKPLKGEVTHKQLMQELSELEAVGYNPGGDDDEYPSDLQAAQQKVQAEYRADCLPAANMTTSQSSATVVPSQASATPAG